MNLQRQMKGREVAIYELCSIKWRLQMCATILCHPWLHQHDGFYFTPCGAEVSLVFFCFFFKQQRERLVCVPIKFGIGAFVVVRANLGCGHQRAQYDAVKTTIQM